MAGVLVRRGNRDTETHRGRSCKGTGTRQTLQAKERGPRRNQPCWHLVSDFKPPEPQEQKCLLLKPPRLWYCYGGPSRLIQKSGVDGVGAKAIGKIVYAKKLDERVRGHWRKRWEIGLLLRVGIGRRAREQSWEKNQEGVEFRKTREESSLLLLCWGLNSLTLHPFLSKLSSALKLSPFFAPMHQGKAWVLILKIIQR